LTESGKMEIEQIKDLYLEVLETVGYQGEAQKYAQTMIQAAIIQATKNLTADLGPETKGRLTRAAENNNLEVMVAIYEQEYGRERIREEIKQEAVAILRLMMARVELSLNREQKEKIETLKKKFELV